MKTFLVLALDAQISHVTRDLLKQHYEIALCAGESRDEDWIEDALRLGANVFISPDVDVPNHLQKLKVDDFAYWIDLPQRMQRKDKQFSYLISRLRKISKGA